MHAFPHEPQFVSDVAKSKQVPLQSVSPGAQVVAHAPFEQTCPTPHSFPHFPQFDRAESVSVSHPGPLVQSLRPASQLATAQVPAEHCALPYGITHAAQSAPHPYAGSFFDTQAPPQSFRSAAHRPVASGGMGAGWGPDRVGSTDDPASVDVLPASM